MAAVSAGPQGSRVLFTQNVTIPSNWNLPKDTIWSGTSPATGSVQVTIPAGVVIDNLRGINFGLQLTTQNTAPCLTFSGDGTNPYVFIVELGALLDRQGTVELAQIPDTQYGVFATFGSPTRAFPAPTTAVFRGMGVGSVLIASQAEPGIFGGIQDADFSGLGTLIEQNGIDAIYGNTYPSFTGSIIPFYGASPQNFGPQTPGTVLSADPIPGRLPSFRGVTTTSLLGPGHRSCNILFFDYNTTVPPLQQDGSIMFPYASLALAIAYTATQPAAMSWRIIGGPGIEPGDVTLPAGRAYFIEGHHIDFTVLRNITQTVDVPYASTLEYANLTVLDTSVVDGGSPNGCIIYTKNARRGAITQTGSSLVAVIDSGLVDEGFPDVFPNNTVTGDTIITGPISGTNTIYEPGCNFLIGQAIQLTGCSIQAAELKGIDPIVVKDTVFGYFNPIIGNNAMDAPNEVFLDDKTTLSWNDQLGTAPNNTFVVTDYGTSNERYSSNTQDRYYFGRQSVLQFRSDWNSPTATWGYLGSPPTRGLSFTTGVPSQARASVTQRKDWLLVQPSYDGSGLFLGSRQLLHPPGSNFSCELGPISMDSYSQVPFLGADVMYYVFSQQAGSDIDLNNLVLIELARIAMDMWAIGMIVITSGSIVYSNVNSISADTCPASYLAIDVSGSVVSCYYSKDRESWKGIGSYDTVLSPMALDRTSIFVQAGQGPNCIFGFKEQNIYGGITI